MKKSREYERALAVQIIMLAPFAPHFASELWSAFSMAKHHLIDKNEIQLDKDVMEQKWPEIDINYKMAVEVRVSTKCLKYLLFHLYKFYITYNTLYNFILLTRDNYVILRNQNTLIL